MKDSEKKDLDSKEWEKAARKRCTREQLQWAINEQANIRKQVALSNKDKDRLNDKVTQLNGILISYSRIFFEQARYEREAKQTSKLLIIASLIIVPLYVVQLFFLDQTNGWQAVAFVLFGITFWTFPGIIGWIRDTAFESDIRRFESHIFTLGVSVSTVKLYLCLGDYHYHLDRMGLDHKDEKKYDLNPGYSA